jgi:glycosyltransferase involved in cell wall biosynthesis
VLTVVTHLPDLTSDYHRNRLEVIYTCLKSMRDGARMEHTLIVWDNGSCDPLRDVLSDLADVVILSPNIGKTAARTSMIRMLPPETIIAYSDDDMYFYPGWLAPQIELLQHFPNVAAVTGYPVRTASRWGCEHTIAWAEANAKLEMGRFLPRSWEDDFCISIGRDPAWHAQSSERDREGRVTYNGKQAYTLGHHCQFVGYQERLVKAAVYDGKAMGDEKVTDRALDAIGLRLATTQRWARHIGNVIHDELRKELGLMPKA